jgi:hypothetical protein
VRFSTIAGSLSNRGINIVCVDDLDVDEALSAPIDYVNGLQNDCGNPPSETLHL